MRAAALFSALCNGNPKGEVIGVSFLLVTMYRKHECRGYMEEKERPFSLDKQIKSNSATAPALLYHLHPCRRRQQGETNPTAHEAIKK